MISQDSSAFVVRVFMGVVVIAIVVYAIMCVVHS